MVNQSTQFGEEILDFVNNMCHSNKDVANTIAHAHRYFQSETFELVCEILRSLADNSENGFTDARNDYACFMAKEMLSALGSQEAQKRYSEHRKNVY